MPTIHADKNLTSPTLMINEDLQEMTSMMKSIGSDSMEEDIPHTKNKKQKPNYFVRDAIDSPQIIRISPKLEENHWREQDFMMKQRKPEGAVLMLPQATQTENRSFIKYLLNLINEAITQQLERQIISKEQYLHTLEKFKNAIPEVYNNVKDSADSFFIKEHQISHRPIYEQSDHGQSNKQLPFVNSQVNLAPSFSSGNLQFQHSLPIGELPAAFSHAKLSQLKKSPSGSP